MHGFILNNGKSGYLEGINQSLEKNISNVDSEFLNPHSRKKQKCEYKDIDKWKEKYPNGYLTKSVVKINE